MIVTRHRELTINMGNYESLKTGASVQYDTEQYTSADIDVKLDALLAPDLKDAAEITQVHDSYVLTWLETHNA